MNYVIFSAILFVIFAQVQNDTVSTALNRFAINFLAETNKVADNLNVALSPYTVWNVLAIINEGARGSTESQLQEALGVPENGPNREEFRRSQLNLTQNILKNYDGISLEILNAVFIRLEKQLNRNYQQLIKRLYNVDVLSLDFSDPITASSTINKKLKDATNGRLNNIVKGADLDGAQMFVTSALFFKGVWKNQFKTSDTKKKPFYDENGLSSSEADMMFNMGVFPYTLVLNNKATAVELPYKGEHMSMIVILPKLNVKLQTILDMMTKVQFSTIVSALKQSAEMFPTDEVRVFLPKFKIESDFTLNMVLHNMGMQHIMSAASADLSNISPDNLYVSRVIHKAQIEVDEEGTEAVATTVAELDNKNIPAVFDANRPFLYFIYDRQTESIVFTGKFIFPPNYL